MYKLVVFAAFLALATAAPGFVSPYAAPISPWGHGLVGAPVVSAPIVKTAVPVATSYANTYRVASPVLAHAPVAYAHAPVVAHAPAVVSPYAAYGQYGQYGQYGHAW